MIKIFPKIDDVCAGVNVIGKYIGDMIEIQMTTIDTSLLIDCVNKIVAKFPFIKEITVHSPMCMCDIEKNFDNKERLGFMYKLTNVCNKLSKKHSIRINMLYHCSNSFVYFQEKKQLWLFRRLIKLMKGHRTYLLLENVVDIELTKKGKEPCISTVKMLRSNKVKMCFDIAHAYAASELNNKNILDVYSDNELNRVVHQVHFSKYKKLEDFRTTYDHCENHSSIEELIIDLSLLKKLKLLKSNIIVEVIETESYELRERELAELQLLEKYCNKEY